VGSNVAVKYLLAKFAEVAVQVPVLGLYSSAEDKIALEAPCPPYASTFPLGRSVREWSRREVDIPAVDVHVPVRGLKSSTVEVIPLLIMVWPATRTLPVGRRTVMEVLGNSFARPVIIDPVNDHPLLPALIGV
jgi:hypothetical protein